MFGFISAPLGNTITVAPGFAPTEGLDIADLNGAALIVVNGTGNTVLLQ